MDETAKMRAISPARIGTLPSLEREPLTQRLNWQIEEAEQRLTKMKKLKKLFEENEQIADAMDLLSEVGVY